MHFISRLIKGAFVQGESRRSGGNMLAKVLDQHHEEIELEFF